MMLAGLIGTGGRCEYRFGVDITGALQILDFSGFNQRLIRSKYNNNNLIFRLLRRFRTFLRPRNFVVFNTIFLLF